ncbi:MAG: hypothetical protein WAW26_27165 [Anaerolineae bacterium]
MNSSTRSESAFETVIETHLLARGYVPVDRAGYDRARAIFPRTALAFIRETQPEEWAKLECERQADHRSEGVWCFVCGCARYQATVALMAS